MVLAGEGASLLGLPTRLTWELKRTGTSGGAGAATSAAAEITPALRPFVELLRGGGGGGARSGMGVSGGGGGGRPRVRVAPEHACWAGGAKLGRAAAMAMGGGGRRDQWIDGADFMSLQQEVQAEATSLRQMQLVRAACSSWRRM